MDQNNSHWPFKTNEPNFKFEVILWKLETLHVNKAAQGELFFQKQIKARVYKTGLIFQTIRLFLWTQSLLHKNIQLTQFFKILYNEGLVEEMNSSSVEILKHFKELKKYKLTDKKLPKTRIINISMAPNITAAHCQFFFWDLLQIFHSFVCEN